MKVRTGFVSNSSTSSFVVITSNENHEQALHTLGDEDLTKFISSLLKKQRFWGEDAVRFCIEDYDYDEDEDGYKEQVMWRRYCSEISKSEKIYRYSIEG